MKRTSRFVCALALVAGMALPSCAAPQTNTQTEEPNQPSAQAPSQTSSQTATSASESDQAYDAPTQLATGASEGEALASTEISDQTYAPEPQTHNTEEYNALSEHGFVSTASNPYSTFSADVDTASYSHLRRMIRDDHATIDSLPAGSVRTEELLNYFDYAYAAPEAGEVFGTTATIADCPWNDQTKLLIMGLQTEQAEYADQHGNNLVFLIDTSGSMEDEDKLGLLRKSFSYLVDNLNADDTISIVTYAGSERVVIDGVAAQNKDKILAALDDLQAEGSTNGEAGLSRAYEIARSHFIEGGNNRIILASDGDLNVGITSEGDLSEYVSKQRDSGVYLSVLGFGAGNYKDNKMEAIADDGNGAYYYIDCMEEAKRVFGDKLCATMRTVAQDVKLQLEFNPAYVKGYRQIGYENRELATEDFTDDTKDAGEVGSGHSVTVAYEIVPVDSPMEIAQPDSKYGNGSSTGVDNGEWLTLAVRAKDPGKDESRLREYAFDADIVTDQPSDDFNFAACVIQFGMLANQSEFAGSATIDDLQRTLDDMDMHDDKIRLEFRELVELAGQKHVDE